MQHRCLLHLIMYFPALRYDSDRHLRTSIDPGWHSWSLWRPIPRTVSCTDYAQQHGNWFFFSCSTEDNRRTPFPVEMNSFVYNGTFSRLLSRKAGSASTLRKATIANTYCLIRWTCTCSTILPLSLGDLRIATIIIVTSLVTSCWVRAALAKTAHDSS